LQFDFPPVPAQQQSSPWLTGWLANCACNTPPNLGRWAEPSCGCSAHLLRAGIPRGGARTAANKWVWLLGGALSSATRDGPQRTGGWVPAEQLPAEGGPHLGWDQPCTHSSLFETVSHRGHAFRPVWTDKGKKAGRGPCNLHVLAAVVPVEHEPQCSPCMARPIQPRAEVFATAFTLH
jgi:hypothetical protein